jgi:PAS domain S-box-containing protein
MGKVLIVDDERSIRETLSEFVKEGGHDTFTAAEAEEALSIVARSVPDVVLSDIVLPGVDGMTLLERIHRIAPDTQVIMITGEPTVETAADAVRQGAFDYLSKPVAREEIQAIVESALRAKRIADERTRLAEENLRYRERLEEEVEWKARALVASEEKYRTVVETANEAVFVAQGGMLRFANPKTQQITGYSEAQLLSMPFSEWIHPEDREMVVDRYRRRLAGEGVPSEYTFRIVDADGATKWIEIRPVVIEWEGREATLNLGSDVTERRHAHDKLRKSEEFLASVFEAIRDGISVLDADLNVIMTNRWMEETYADQMPLAGRKCYQVYQQRESPCSWCPTLRTVETGDVQQEVVPYPSAEGHSGWIELSTFPIKDERGEVHRVIEYVKDITEREEAAEALAESEARYRTLFADSPISLWHDDFSGVKDRLDRLRADGVTDLSGYLEEHPELVRECVDRVRVVEVNDATLEMHGVSTRQELLGNLDDVLTDTSRRDFADQLLAIWKGCTSFAGTTIDRTIDGVEKHVEIRWSVPPGHEKTFDRVLVSKSDITPAVQAGQVLRQALGGTIAAIGLTTEMRDPYTAGHQRRVTELAAAIAEEIALDPERIEGIQAAGAMHDIGKMAVPAEILNKPSELSDVEMSLIQAHPQVAYDILRTVAFPWPVAEIVLQHHERIDGSGYPRGLVGDEIRLEARILAVADTVEAMASHRPYRPSLGIEAALREIEENKGTWYDAEVVGACVRVFRDHGFSFPENPSDPD